MNCSRRYVQQRIRLRAICIERHSLQLAAAVNTSVQNRFPDERVQVIGEPGRFFVEAAYTLICKIHAKREVRNKNGKLEKNMYFLNDGMYGHFAAMFYRPEELTPVLYLVRK